MSILQKRTFIGGLQRRLSPSRSGKKTITIAFDKRQKFVIAVASLTILLLVAEFQFGKSGVMIAVVLTILTNLFLFWAIRDDTKEFFSLRVFILPTLYSLSFALFFFLTPTSVVSRIITTALYSFGLYSLFLSQNIFIVGSIRTIALLSGARIVSFVITILSFFFLTNIVFTLHVHLLPTVGFIALYTFLLIYQSLWTYTLQKGTAPLALWTLAITVCILEATAALWFWPSSPTVIALFLSGLFYTIVGLSHVWLEKRLFRGVLWEYVWVGVAVFFVLVLFTSWGK